jgi:hypothetical protein
MGMRADTHTLMGFLLREKHPLCEVQHAAGLLRSERHAVEFAAPSYLSFPRRRESTFLPHAPAIVDSRLRGNDRGLN